MMGLISFQEIDKVYQASVSAVFGHWTEETQSEIAQHCCGWSQGLFDFKSYLEASSIRFYEACGRVAAQEARECLAVWCERDEEEGRL